MATAAAEGVAELVERLDQAVALGDARAITARVKRDLAELIRDGTIRLPERFFEPRPDTYARRLLHRDEARGYSAVVMTWGPGQGTPLHDHAGIWCVEGVVAGEMDILQFELDGEPEGERYRFVPRGRAHALAGASGALIPPFEYHILKNGRPDDVSVTLHVYGGDMTRCFVFEPDGPDAYRRRERPLVFHDAA